MNICRHYDPSAFGRVKCGKWEKTRLPSPNLHVAHAAFSAEPTVQLQRPASRSGVASVGIQFMNH